MTKELILQAREKANAGLRLNLQEALALYEDNDLLFLADCARRMKEKKSGRQVFYNVNKHINLTNICTSGCPLCKKKKKEEVWKKEEVNFLQTAWLWALRCFQCFSEREMLCFRRFWASAPDSNG